MTLAADRAAIAVAVDAVQDITGYDDQPALLNVGDAWVRWGGYAAGKTPVLIFETTWLVDVITGGTPTDAMQFLDAHLALILGSLETIGWIVSVVPVDFQIPNAGVLYGAEINLKKES
jgi:hypothetical protein